MKKELQIEIRRDTVRVTKKYAEILNLIKKNEGIDNRTDCYRLALDLYKQNIEIAKELKENKNELLAIKESIESLYSLNLIIYSKVKHDCDSNKTENAISILKE